jgi:hypothetical protein
MTSPEKCESNRKNSRKSTGPKTAEGKARVARNAVTHGLTASPGEPTEAYRRELAEWIGDLKRPGAAERALAERGCRASWNLRRCDRYEDATAARRDRDAAEVHDLAEAARAEAIGRRLLARPGSFGDEPDIERAVRDARPGGGAVEVEREEEAAGYARPGDDDPVSLLAELRRTPAGVSWLMARWADLGRALKAPGGWDEARKFAAVRLLGLRPEEADGHPLIGRVTPGPLDLVGSLGGHTPFGHPAMEGSIDAACDASRHGLGTPKALWYGYLAAIIERQRASSGAGPSGAKLAALVRAEREKLARRMRRVLKARAAEDRAGAADRSLFDESKSLSLCLRYATAASRDLHRSVRDLIKLREEADDEGRDDEPQPSPSPRPPGDESGPGPVEGLPDGTGPAGGPSGDPGGPCPHLPTGEADGRWTGERAATSGTTDAPLCPPRSAVEGRADPSPCRCAAVLSLKGRGRGCGRIAGIERRRGGSSRDAAKLRNKANFPTPGPSAEGRTLATSTNRRVSRRDAEMPRRTRRSQRSRMIPLPDLRGISASLRETLRPAHSKARHRRSSTLTPPRRRGQAECPGHGLDGESESRGVHRIAGRGLKARDASRPEGVEVVHPRFAEALGCDRRQGHEPVTGVGAGAKLQSEVPRRIAREVAAQVGAFLATFDPGGRKHVRQGPEVEVPAAVLVRTHERGYAGLGPDRAEQPGEGAEVGVGLGPAGFQVRVESRWPNHDGANADDPPTLACEGLAEGRGGRGRKVVAGFEPGGEFDLVK